MTYIIRGALTGCLLFFGVLPETGWYTVITLFLVVAGLEIQIWLITIRGRQISKLVINLERLSTLMAKFTKPKKRGTGLE